ncbi:MAG: exopolysaccharide biosynthesis polyprenyl glycosylphosphotransferase [Lachnospiraceae bacterium]|nr:exopolysaccharide biosynthesis polyprenyl glycosylphosphotransferase [Lachnospiraceae bacterium]
MQKNDSAKRLLLLVMSFLGVLFLTAVYSYTWLMVYHQRLMFNIKFTFWGHVLIIFIYFLLLLFLNFTYGGMKIGYLKMMDIIFSQIFSLICVNLVTYLQYSLMEVKLVWSSGIIRMTLVQIVISVLWNYICNRMYLKVFPPRELLLVYGDRPTEDILCKFASRPDKFRITESVHINLGLQELYRRIASSHKAVVLWDIPTDIRNELFKFCYSRSIRVYMMPKITDVLIKGSDQLHLFDTPILLSREYPLKLEQRIAKRMIDLFCAVVLLLISAPIQIVTAICIKVYDKGPVLYKQTRCTTGGREFQIMKFRSMRVDAEKDGVARLAAKHDERITPVGKVIRAVRIDELPQLFNIIKGEMSFIGPRPERPEIIRRYMEEMPEFALRTKVKAGLAGYAQVYGKYNTTPYDKLKLDLSYIENYSLWLDIKLMLLTLKILFKPESTEGIEDSQTTAMKEEKEKKDVPPNANM